MIPAAGREVRLAARPDGAADPSHFELAEAPVREPGEGEILVRNEWLSVDPYMRGQMDDARSAMPTFELGEPMGGSALGTVIASRSEVPEGATVVHLLGWREYATVDAAKARPVDLGLAPAPAHLGVLGFIGLTAYVGLTEIASVRDGDVVFVSGAAGAVGSVAGQIARLLGASRVIGSAGGPVKTAKLLDGFGFDAAIDHREGDLERRLGEAAPDGIDVYFDNVGGDHLRAAIAVLNDHGRVALCGAVSQYDKAEPDPGPDNLIEAVFKRLTLRGFVAIDHYPEVMDEYVRRASGWLREGCLHSEETVVKGIDNAVDAFLGIFAGRNVGKMLVRLD
ncbi:NADP-dependent oxidoreductase [Actinomadura rugatobispora]|uniref:NADP-dependent oxidoreductase n=1 Tax=Actinomadura rugatobispora TaxID=1994 RepID=A0ABW0ZQ28_9ACTN|nr:NADP-dependent oxidoreductase [Actinomadura rugatobispora]